MQKLIIDPCSINGDYNNDKSVRKGFTYLHGDLQDHNGYDIMAVVPPFDWKPGIYPCNVIGYKGDCTFYLWQDELRSKNLHGLVVANTDEKSVKYAIKCYNEKVSSL